jgi:hypothetical protein
VDNPATSATKGHGPTTISHAGVVAVEVLERYFAGAR